MNFTRTVRWVAFLFAALFFLAAYPAYSAILAPDDRAGWGAQSNGPQGKPTESPSDRGKDKDVNARDDVANTQMNTAVTIDVLANDDGVDREDSQISIVDGPEHGRAEIQSAGRITYTPSTGFTGEDQFEYEVCRQDDDDDDDDDDDGDDGDTAIETDNKGKGKGKGKGNGKDPGNGNGKGNGNGDDEDCDTAKVRVIVDAPPVSNEAPTAKNDIFSIEQGKVLSASAPGVLANDTDPNDDALTAVLARTTENGSLTLNSNGSFTYTPADEFAGVDSFTYRASDGEHQSNLGTVEIEVIDIEPPTVRWLSPVSEGEILEVGYEMVRLEVEAFDNGGIDKVHFFRWDANVEEFIDIAEVTEPPYAVEFHASLLNYEWNQILVRVHDSAGNVSERIFIWIFQTVNGTRVYIPSVNR
jgi:VCBS repeat-containing protein